MMPIGISLLVSVLARKSEYIIKTDPYKIASGITYLSSSWIKTRIIFGIASPTQPIVPLILTDKAVSNVEETITIFLAEL